MAGNEVQDASTIANSIRVNIAFDIGWTGNFLAQRRRAAEDEQRNTNPNFPFLPLRFLCGSAPLRESMIFCLAELPPSIDN
jgi:hypothetical protein